MGLFSDLFSQNNSADEHIPAIMPPGALDQIRQGIIPTMRTDRIMLTQGEVCHFSERAILMTEKTQKRYEELVTLITQRFNARAIMFKIRPESPEFKTLDEVKAKTYLALSYTMLTKGTNKKTAVLFNESQWIGKILFSQEEA